MMLVLVVALLSGQTIYEWVDAQGQSHFTDDASTIPRGAKRRETKGADITVMPAPKAQPVAEDQPASNAADQQVATQPEVDACQAANAEVHELERRMEAQVMAGARLQESQGYACQQKLLTHGQGNFAMCMAGRSEPLPPDQSVALDLEDAREALRRAQVNGCRPEK